MNLEKLFNPKSIAVVGASTQVGKVGNVIAKNLTELGYAGEVYFVNPKYQEIFGKKCYRKLSELERDVDLAIMAIPAELAILEIKGNCDRIKNYVVISAGFSEIGNIGKKREEALAQLAKEKKLNILGPNCLGFIIPNLKLNASFSGGMPGIGHVSFISQSGALAVAIMDRAQEEGLKFSSIISIGNKTQIDESEMMDYLARDEKTKVIGMYLEGVQDGMRFIETAKVVSKIKPVIILKAGRSEQGRQAISSHTGALAGSDDIISAVFKKTGVIRAENLEEFIDLLNITSNFNSVPGQYATIITNAGGLGVLAADAFGGKKVKLIEPENTIQTKLKKILPEEASVKNPIDLLGDAKEDRYKSSLEIISSGADFGTVICLLTPQDQTPVEAIAQEIIAWKNAAKKEVIAIFLGGERIRSAAGKLRANGIVNFSFPDRAISALNKFYEWSQYSASKYKEPAKIKNEKRKDTVQKIIKEAKKEGRVLLYFNENRTVLEQYGICAVNFLEINPEDKISLFNLAGNKAGLEFPVALKIDSDKFVHKTEKEGVILGIKNEGELDAAMSKMRSNFKNTRLIVQSMAHPGVEIIIGIKKDRIFGPIIICGLGGIYTEIFKMADSLVPPLAISEIEKNLSEGKLGFLFKNTREKNPYDANELSRVILGVGLMAFEIPEIKGFDINPIVIYNNGEAAKILDVKIII